MRTKACHGFVVKNKWELDVEIGTCSVDMYAKCGLLKYSCFFFCNDDRLARCSLDCFDLWFR